MVCSEEVKEEAVLEKTESTDEAKAGKSRRPRIEIDSIPVNNKRGDDRDECYSFKEYKVVDKVWHPCEWKEVLEASNHEEGGFYRFERHAEEDTCVIVMSIKGKEERKECYESNKKQSEQYPAPTLTGLIIERVLINVLAASFVIGLHI